MATWSDDRWPIVTSGGIVPGLGIGAVTLMATSPAAGGNILIPGSHRWFSDIPVTYSDRVGRLPAWLDHFRFPVDDPRLQESPPVKAANLGRFTLPPAPELTDAQRSLVG